MRALTPALLSLNTATTKAWTLAQAVDGCARHGIGGISPWRLTSYRRSGTPAARRLIADAGLAVSGLCRGGWYTAEGALTQAVLDDNRRAVDEAAEIDATCLVMVVGGLPEGSTDLSSARAIVAEGLAATTDYARGVGVPIAIEPLHPAYAADRACVNTMAQALDMAEAIGDGIGVAMDAYHVWWDPDLSTQIARAGRDRLLAFHVCDWRRETRDLLLDRGMMGEGVIDLRAMREEVEATGFDGLVEFEIFSTEWWARDPDEALESAVAWCAHG